MSEKPSAEDRAPRQRRLAGQADDRAWSRAEQPSEHHRQATQQVVAIADPQDRAILEDTLRVLPVPAANPEPASPSTGATVRRQGRCAAG
jgi:hypothetical protein